MRRFSLRQLSTIVAAFPLPAYTLAPDGTVLSWNGAAERVLGWSAKETLGQPLPTLPPGESESFAALVERAAREGPIAGFEARQVRKDGAPVDLSLAIVALLGKAGQLEGVSVVAQDITEKKKLQSQLELASRMSAVGSLAAGVAHEMSNPLAFSLASLDFALEELARTHGPPQEGAPLDAEVLQALVDAREGIERVRIIVQDLRAFSRQNEGEVHVPIDVRAAIQMALKLARVEVRDRATVVLDLGDVPPVLASEQRLGQVFLNLLVNAAQAIPEGNAKGHQIRVATRAEDDRVIVEVQDTGAGMPPQVRERVFDPFFTTKPPGVGTGLGLTICHGIIAALGGDIQVESAVGVGTTVRVELPIAAPCPAGWTGDDWCPAGARVTGPPEGSCSHPRRLRDSS